MKHLKVKVKYVFNGEYDIPITNKDYETLVYGECTADNDPEIDIAHEAFMRLRKDNGFDEYIIADDSDYAIFDGDDCIVGWD